VAKGADCKSAVLRLRRFESYLSHHFVLIKEIAFSSYWFVSFMSRLCRNCLPSIFNGLQQAPAAPRNMNAT
jgi:hypothetical protein